jgi:hypothetical protein
VNPVRQDDCAHRKLYKVNGLVTAPDYTNLHHEAPDMVWTEA